MAVGLGLQPALAASACKGLEEGACGARDQCYWVDGYTRKDGVNVSAHCRKAPGQKASTSKPAKGTGPDSGSSSD